MFSAQCFTSRYLQQDCNFKDSVHLIWLLKMAPTVIGRGHSRPRNHTIHRSPVTRINYTWGQTDRKTMQNSVNRLIFGGIFHWFIECRLGDSPSAAHKVIKTKNIRPTMLYTDHLRCPNPSICWIDPASWKSRCTGWLWISPPQGYEFHLKYFPGWK